MGDLLVIMTQFVLKIALGNDAMRTKGDVVRALDNVQEQMKKEYSTIHGMKNECRKIIDVNGNTVGNWEVK